MKIYLVIFSYSFITQSSVPGSGAGEQTKEITTSTPVSKCELITNRFCQHLGQGYVKTTMPNFLGHRYQSEAEIAMQEYSPLLQLNCSRYLRFFLCSVYSPFCSEHVVGAIHSCRNLCQQVYEDCSLVIQQVGISWSERFNCSNLPEMKKNSLCMQFPKINGNYSSSSTSTKEKLPVRKVENSSCLTDHIVWEESSSQLLCQPRCDRDVFYSESDKKLLERWMFAWAILCFMSTLFTLLTFAINRSRFNYPEQPIIFFVICYNAISVLYICRYAIGSQTFICRSNSENISYVVPDGLENPVCTVSFLLHYYLHLSANVWWFILSLAWFLSAAKKWSTEAISDWSSCFHCVAWAAPGFLAVLTLSLHNVSGDELSGLCRISQNSLIFSIAPNAIMLLSTCLICIFTSTALSRVKYELNQSGRSVFKLEKLTTRLVVFQLFYIIPSVITIICSLYETYFQQQSSNETNLPFVCTAADNCNHNSDVEMALIKIFSQLFIGIMSGMWVWTQKTCYIWLHFIVPSNGKNDIFLSS